MSDPTVDAFDPARHLAQLSALCETFWQAEAAVVTRYLRDARSHAADVAWLRLAAYKETRLYRELTPGERARYAARGAGDERWRVLDEEMCHYRLIAELVTELGGTPPAPDEVLDFPADRALQRKRATLRASADPLERCLSALVEGGGGAIYRVLAALDATPFDRRVARVFARILDDEIDHGPAHWPQLLPLLRGPADSERARDHLTALGRLRVAMREAMFFPTRPRAAC